MFRHSAAVVLVFLIAVTPPAVTIMALQPAGDGTGVYCETLPGVAWVVTDKPARAGQRDECEATAWLADAKGRLLVTNAHVTDRANSIRVYFPSTDRSGRVASDRAWYEAVGSGILGRVVTTDARKDLSVIQVDELPRGVKELKLALQSAPRGAAAFTIGNPASSQALWACAYGTVKEVYPLALRDGTFAGQVLECSAPAASGASGSPVVNTAGEVIGVVFATTKSARPVTLSVDAVEVRAILEAARAVTANAAAINTAR